MLFFSFLIAILSLCSLLTIPTTSATSYSFSLTPSIEHATLYSSQQAAIERLLPLQESVDIGHHEVIIKGFQHTLDDASLRVGSSSSDLEILDYKVTSNRVLKSESEAYKKQSQHLQSEKIVIDMDLKKTNMKITTLEGKLTVLQGYASSQLTSSTSTKSLLPSEALTILQFEEQETMKVHEELLKWYETRMLQQQKSSEWLQRWTEFQEGGREEIGAKELYVHIHAKKAFPSQSNLQLLMNYFCSPAYWLPYYDVYVDNKEDVKSQEYAMQINYYAQVTQQTGEDWKDVKLSLSTTSPQSLPTLIIPRTRAVYDQSKAPMMMKAAGGMAMRGKRARSQGMMSAPMAMASMADAGEMAESISFEADNHQADMFLTGTGDISIANVFHINYPVNVTTLAKTRNHGVQEDHHKLLIQKIKLDSKLYTYVVPAQQQESYLTTFTKYPATSSLLLSSHGRMRINLEGNHVGTTAYFPGIRPNEVLKLNIGVNHNIVVTSKDVIPSHLNAEEDKSTWFVTDKRKFRLRNMERIITVKNTYSQASDTTASNEVLVLVAENVPKTTEEQDIKVDIISPPKKDFVTLQVENEDSLADDEYINHVLTKEFATHAQEGNNHLQDRAYLCKSSHNVYWAIWIKPGDTKNLSLKYKITNPDEKPTVIV